MESKKGHIYEEVFPVEVEYTYNKPGYRKVYDTEKLKRKFKTLLKQFQAYNKTK
tara:strand:+ start:1137 stop:1298 length:162 start_codon:yes stop_codon:yes gene_type:complete